MVKKASKLFSVFEKEISSHKNVQNLHAVKMAFDDDLELNENKFKLVFLFDDAKPLSVEAVYLKLYLISLGKVAPCLLYTSIHFMKFLMKF